MRRIIPGCMLLLGLAGLSTAPRLVQANGGPFIVKYPGGDPAAKGVLARLDPDLKPQKEERLRVVGEDLKISFHKDSFPGMSGRRGARTATRPAEDLLMSVPLAHVIAAYTIENPTDAEVEVDFGFPILRGIFMHPYSMMPRPEVKVSLDGQDVQSQLISNSAIYGIIRQRARELIDKSVAADPELDVLVARARCTNYVRQRARAALSGVVQNKARLEQVAAEDSVVGPLARSVNSEDPEAQAARAALCEYLTDKLKWPKTTAVLMAQMFSLDIDTGRSMPRDRGGFWLEGEDAGRYLSANLGSLAAIGEQKATQLLVEIAAQFDPACRSGYEEIFKAWGGDVREQSIDLNTGKLRPREISIDKDLLDRFWGGGDPTLYARVDYLEKGNLSDAEQEICRTILKNLPVVFTFAPMNLLHYRVKFPPHKTRMLTVEYQQNAFVDSRPPATYQLAYVVHPASLWKDFGPIRLEVAVPEAVAGSPRVPTLRASVECRREAVENRESPASLTLRPSPDARTQKVSYVVYRGIVADKTGELYIGLDAAAWRGEPAPTAQQPANAPPRQRQMMEEGT